MMGTKTNPCGCVYLFGTDSLLQACSDHRALTPTPGSQALGVKARHMRGRELQALAELAIEIALGCPLERSGPGCYTYARRDTVRKIRLVLEQAGIPWKQQHKELHRK